MSGTWVSCDMLNRLAVLMTVYILVLGRWKLNKEEQIEVGEIWIIWKKENDENIHHSRHFLHCTCFMSFIITRVQKFFSFRDINPVCADVQLLFCMLMIAFLPLVIWEWQGENSSPRDTCSCSLKVEQGYFTTFVVLTLRRSMRWCKKYKQLQRLIEL